MRGLIRMPISAGSVTAAEKDDATPSPKPIADDHSSAWEGIDMHSVETTQHSLPYMGGRRLCW